MRGEEVDLFDGSAAASRIQHQPCGNCGRPCFKGELHLCPPMAAARSTDPGTSFDAARRVERSGKAGSDRAKCLAVVEAHPGLTAPEIALKCGLTQFEASRRLPELRRAGRVRNGEERGGFLTWWPV